MTTVTFTKLTTAKTLPEMKSMMEAAKGRLFAEPHAEGFEVRDLRGLVDRLNDPIRGRGIKRYLGETHFIVTGKLLERYPDVVFA